MHRLELKEPVRPGMIAELTRVRGDGGGEGERGWKTGEEGLASGAAPGRKKGSKSCLCALMDRKLSENDLTTLPYDLFDKISSMDTLYVRKKRNKSRIIW